jgi:hypothetical protein
MMSVGRVSLIYAGFVFLAIVQATWYALRLPNKPHWLAPERRETARHMIVSFALRFGILIPLAATRIEQVGLDEGPPRGPWVLFRRRLANAQYLAKSRMSNIKQGISNRRS